MFLTANDIELEQIQIATADGQAPTVTFTILNIENVLQMLNVNTYLRGRLEQLETERLSIDIDDTNQTIRFSRVVSPRTSAYAANQTLALSLLALVLSDQGLDGTRADIHAMAPEITDNQIHTKRMQRGVHEGIVNVAVPAFRS